MLCQEGEIILQSRGYVEVVLWVFEANEQARGFYEALGCETDGATKVLDLGAPLTAVRYHKSLGCQPRHRLTHEQGWQAGRRRQRQAAPLSSAVRLRDNP